MMQVDRRLTRGGEGAVAVQDKLMTLSDLSEMLGVPMNTLYRWRHRGDGHGAHRAAAG